MPSFLKNISLFTASIVFVATCGVYTNDALASTPKPAAPGTLLLDNAKALADSGRMTLAINPQSHNDVYVATWDSSGTYSTVSIMRPDSNTGVLTKVGMIYKVQGLEWVTQILVDPAGKHAYIYGRTPGGAGVAIVSYGVDPDGMLFYENTVSMEVGDIFNCCMQTLTGVTLSPDGRFMYSYYPVKKSGSFGFDVTVYSVGLDARISPIDTIALPYIGKTNSQSPSAVGALVASNHYVYVQHADGSGISTYSNNQGKLTLVSDGENVNVNHYALAMALDPSGKNLYTATLEDNKVKLRTYLVAQNGILAIANVSDGIDGGGTPFDVMAIDSSRHYLYLLQTNGIAMYRFGASDTALIPLGMESTYKTRSLVYESPGFFTAVAGKYLYTLGLTDKSMLSTYKITQSVPEQLIAGHNSEGVNWKSIHDTQGVTASCHLSEACNLHFSGSVQSTEVTLTADDADNSAVSFMLGTKVNDEGIDVLNVSGCSVSGNVNSDLCTHITINADTPSVVHIPAP